MITRLALVGLTLLSLSACNSSRTRESFAPLAEEFVTTTLAFSPVSATGVGYHEHKGIRLDELLDDVSPAALEAQRRFYREFEARLAHLDPARLNAEDRADLEVVRGQIALAHLEFHDIQSYRHNPTIYVETAGNAFFSPHVLQYAPLETRLHHIIARLQRLPAFLDQAKSNLADSPPIWTTVAIEENSGTIDLVDHLIRASVPEAMRADYTRAAAPALAALHSFNDWLAKELKPASEEAWRLGQTNYAAKFHLALGSDRTPDQVLAAAEGDLNTVRARMLELARPLYAKWFPRESEPQDPNGVIRAVLGRIAARHATPETYLADARLDLDEARQFLRSHSLLALPGHDNLEVIPTPEFVRGIYAVGGFQPAPALEPALGAFYWITPIPGKWPASRKESKLREYNFYKLKLLTLHEAIPGHYVQAEYANQVEPQSRRLLRAVYSNGPYVEGWAQYATEMVLDAGYLNNSPELRLTFLKEELRVLANAILDIRLHARQMADREALELMTSLTFQETEEATAKLRRAKLSSCQLPTYYVGWREWLRVRDRERSQFGARFRLAAFNQRALREGALPLPTLGRLLTDKTAGK